MKIIVGHTNMDLDCIASMVLAKYLYPDHSLVKSHLVHPVAKNLMNMYGDRMGFIGTKDLKNTELSHLVVVDTRSPERIQEYIRDKDLSNTVIDIWDHHPGDGNDIAGATVYEGEFGANTSQLALELIKRGIKVSAEDATIALTGIYADTGNFTHKSVRESDFDAASWLLSCGADMSLVKDFLSPLRDRHQLILFHEVLNAIEVKKIQGHLVHYCYICQEEDSNGMGAVIEQVFELLRAEIMMGFFHFRKSRKTLVIGRNSKSRIHLGELLSPMGGGGHPQAASVTIKSEDGATVLEKILLYMEDALAPAILARDVMNTEFETIQPERTVMDASLVMESTMQTGLPVIDSDGMALAIITLKDIMKARKAAQMHVELRHFMSRKLVSLGSEANIREIDDAMFEHEIGHIPIIDDGRILGIINRGDLLAIKKNELARRNTLVKDLTPDSPPPHEALKDEPAMVKLPH